MKAVDAHIHWFPETYYKFLVKRSANPRAEYEDGRWSYLNGDRSVHRMSPEWFNLDMHFATVAKTGHDMAIISSLGIHSDLDNLPAEEARDAARLINEEWSAAQRRYPGNFFAAAAIPLQDTDMAVAELEYAVGTLGLRGASLPGSIAGEPLDAPRLEAFYARAEQLDVPLFVHPTDGAFVDAMPGYDKAIYRSLGRVVDSSVAVLRLVFSGLMDRYPKLRILHFHAGGVLPYAVGRLDKNARIPTLADPPSAYLKRMWVDTAMPHSLTFRMALDFYGSDRVLYGSDNPCWNPLAALETVQVLGMSEEIQHRVLRENARGLINLEVPANPTGALA
jgi:aminocarboxymuconate-semialdehyde decarboxylase